MTMHTIFRRARHGALLAAALTLAGCSLLQPQKLFLLPRVPAPETSVSGLSDELIVLPRISLPAYVADNRIALLGSDELGQEVVTRSSEVAWADDPERALTAALARAIDARTDAAALPDPWPTEAVPTIKVDVVVREYVGAPGGLLTLEGEYLVSDMRRNGLAIARAFSIEARAPKPGVAGLTAAHSIALGRLADEIAAALAARFAG